MAVLELLSPLGPVHRPTGPRRPPRTRTGTGEVLGGALPTGALSDVRLTLIEAAVAHQRATGDRTLLDIALEHPTGATAVPYFARANRGPGEMAVWLPLAG